MRSAILSAAALIGTARASTGSLASVCTADYAASIIPTDLFGMTIDATSVTAAPVYNASASGSVMFPDATFDYCNITMAYSHNGRNDSVLLNFWTPTPEKFQNRWLSTGGGGLAINSGATTSGSLPGGVQYGAVSGITDGGFGGFTTVRSDFQFHRGDILTSNSNGMRFSYSPMALSTTKLCTCSDTKLTTKCPPSEKSLPRTSST